PCTLTISPTSQSFLSSGGSGTISVTIPTGCSWTATSNVPWVSITSGSSGSGNGTVSYSVAANPTTSARSGLVTISGPSSFSLFTVNQDGIPCSFTISPTSQSFTSDGGSG